MPTFTAIALDRLLEPGASKSVANAKPEPGSKSVCRLHPKLDRFSNHLNGSSSTSSNSSTEKKCHWAHQISPALYATPEATPLPDSLSSFPPSPYIINHKRRGPRLLKSSSQDNVFPLQSTEQSLGDEKVVGNERGGGGRRKEVIASAKSLPVSFTVPSPIKEEKHVNDLRIEKFGSSRVGEGTAGANDLVKIVEASPERGSESTGFFDLRESMSYASNSDGEDNGRVERSLIISTPMAEFFDAWEELSSEGGAHTSFHDIEAEIHEIKLSLLVEIEKRKQAEEALINMQNHWRRIARHLSDVGLTLPPDPVILEDEQAHAELAKELRQQVYLARFVSESVGRGSAKADVEMEMEARIKSKNFEMARLWDRLHYYEAMNREMSQRNQETVENARRRRQGRKRRQRWYWGLVAATITIATGALAWSYLPPGKGSSSSNHSLGPEENDLSK